MARIRPRSRGQVCSAVDVSSKAEAVAGEIAILWFPSGEYEKAIERWESLAEESQRPNAATDMEVRDVPAGAAAVAAGVSSGA